MELETNNSSLSVEEINDALSTDDDSTDDVGPYLDDEISDPDDSSKSDDEESDDESEEEEEETIELKDGEETEEEDDEDFNLITPYNRKALLKDYPDILKKYPYIDIANRRDKEFTEIYATVEDARDANSKATALDSFESDLLDGKTEPILKQIKNSDEGAFKKIVDDYLPALKRVDESAYTHITTNMLKNTIGIMTSEGQRTSDKQLQAAAQIVSKFFLNTEQAGQATNLAPEQTDNSEADKLKKDRADFETQKRTGAESGLMQKVENTLRATIDNHIDTKDEMSAYVKKNAVRDVMDTVSTLLKDDRQFDAVLKGLWKKAADKNYSADSVALVGKAYKSKARTLLKASINKTRKEVLKSQTVRASGNDRVKHVSTRQSVRKTPKVTNDGRGMSTLDFLNS